MTEDEAKTKWCPAFRGNDHGINRPFEIDAAPPGYCLGSACMAWRSTGAERGPILERFRAEPGSTRPKGDDWGYVAADPNSASKGGDWVRYGPSTVTHGYCGLAGEGN